MTVGRLLFLVALVVVMVALFIRYPLHIYEELSNGRGFFGSAAHLFSFFTIVMNTLVALCLLARTTLFEQRLALFRQPSIVGTAIAGILIVMIVYHRLLSATHNPEGISVFTNICLHYIVPIVFPLWWYFGGRTGDMNWALVPKMVIIPLLYLVWVFARGAIINEYPYGFLNIAERGIAGVAPVLIAITALFLIFGSFIVFLDKRTAVK